jgi:chemotaxis protein CheX
MAWSCREEKLMKVKYINPFIESVYDLFSSTLNCAVERGDVVVFWETPETSDIVVLIAMAGSIEGTVAISFPVSTALSIVGKIHGSVDRIVDETVKDNIAELVSQVADSAKEKFVSGEGVKVDLGEPIVVRGTDNQVDYPDRTVWLEVPFESELGPFSLRVTFKANNQDGEDVQ